MITDFSREKALFIKTAQEKWDKIIKLRVQLSVIVSQIESLLIKCYLLIDSRRVQKLQSNLFIIKDFQHY